MEALEYHSNNSGGSWWLTDDNWRALEAAGWDVDWFADDPDGFGPYADGRFLGALASRASKDFATAREGIAEWEAVTGLASTALGCNCCGEPHDFDFGGEHPWMSTPTRGEWDF